MSVRADSEASSQPTSFNVWKAPPNVYLKGSTPLRWSLASALGLLLAHTVLIYMFWMVARCPGNLGSWTPLVLLDFPSGLAPWFTYMYLPPLSDQTKHNVFAIQFAIAGGLQWVCFGGYAKSLFAQHFNNKADPLVISADDMTCTSKRVCNAESSQSVYE